MDVEERIDRLEQSVSDLHKEISELKEALKKEIPVSDTQWTERQQENPSKQRQRDEVESVLSVFDEQERRDKEERIRKAAKMEERFGGKGMSFIAACLVVIGLILFGSMIYERLSDIARATALFLVSGAILAGGILLYSKKKNWFSLSLTGCGYAALFASFFMTNFSFRLISDELLYGLILLWLAGIGFFVFKTRSVVVGILGEVGIAFSTVAGTLLQNDEKKFLFLFLFFFVSSLLYFWIVLFRFLPEPEGKHYHWLYIVTSVINELILIPIVYACEELRLQEGYSFTIFFVSLFSIIYMGLVLVVLLFFQRRKAGIKPFRVIPPVGEEIPEQAAFIYQSVGYLYLYFGLLQIINSYLMALFTTSLFHGNIELSALFSAIFLFLLWILTEVFGVTGKEGKGISVVTFFAILFFLPPMSDYAKCSFLMISSLVLIISYFWREYGLTINMEDGRNHYIICEQHGRFLSRLMSIMLLFPMIYAICKLAEHNAAAFIFWSVITFIMFFVHCMLLHCGRGEGLGLLSNQKHSTALLGVIYLAAFIFSYRVPWAYFTKVAGAGGFHERAITFLFPVLLNFYVLLTKAHRGAKDKERFVDRVARTLNFLLLVVGTLLLYRNDAKQEVFLFVVIIAATLMLCCGSLRRLASQKENRVFYGIYIGVKVTAYLLAVLLAFQNVPNFAVSILLLMIAITSVWTGFLKRLPSLRIYGLILSMLTVLKLMLLDLKHKDSLQTVGCFLLAGVFCFLISLIYSRVKGIAEKNEKNFEKGLDN